MLDVVSAAGLTPADDAPSRADDAWAGYSMMSLAVGLMVLVVVVALAACRGNATPGPRESLGAGMLSWGFVAVRYRLIISPLVLCLFGALIGAGMPAPTLSGTTIAAVSSPPG